MGETVRIERVEAFRVRLPLVREFETSSHRKSSLEHILVRLTDAEGAAGWGEVASPSQPYFSSETVETCWIVLAHHLGPALLDAAWDHPREAAAAWHRVRGHHFAKAGLDIACWDLWCRRQGVALASALGGTRAEIAVGVSLGIEQTVDDLVSQVDLHVRQGYGRVKLKIAPGWEGEPVRAVRARYPDLIVQVDANGAYAETREHLASLTALDDLGLAMIEQPFAPGALAAHARLQRAIRTPVCLDESVDDLDQLDTALALGAGRVLNIKVSRMGGLTAAVAAHDQARAAGLDAWCGGMHEFGVGRAANVAVASLPGYTLPGDVSGSDKYFAEDVVDPPIRARRGMVPVPHDRPGLGHAVDEDRVRASATHTLDLRP